MIVNNTCVPALTITRRNSLYFFLWVILFMWSISSVNGQSSNNRFRFAANLKPLISQVDGDGHQGFRDLGIQFGIQGELLLSKNISFIVQQNYTSFGSKSPSLNIHQLPVYITEVDIKTANLLLGFNFGIYTSAKKKTTDIRNRLRREEFSLYHLVLGVKVHQVIKAENNSLFNGAFQTIPLNHLDFKSKFLGVHFSNDLRISKGVYFSMGIDFIIQNILNEFDDPINATLKPYYITVGTSFYL